MQQAHARATGNTPDRRHTRSHAHTCTQAARVYTHMPACCTCARAGIVSGFKEVRFVRGRAFSSDSSTYKDFEDFIAFLRLLCADMKVRRVGAGEGEGRRDRDGA